MKRAAVLLALVPLACTQILGDDFAIGSGGAGGAGGAATPGSSPASSSAAAGGSGGAGAGGAPGGSGPCELGTTHGCDPGEKCTVLDVGNATVGCVPAGTGGPTTLCDDDSECAVGLFCDGSTGVCEPICSGPGTQSSCGLGWCVDTGFPGYGLCTVGCDPTAPSACPDPALSCGWWRDTEQGESTFHCTIAIPDGGDKVVGEACSLIMGLPIAPSCAPGLVCLDDLDMDDMGTCLRWCKPAGTPGSCPAPQSCLAFPLPLIQHGVEYGVCL